MFKLILWSYFEYSKSNSMPMG